MRRLLCIVLGLPVAAVALLLWWLLRLAELMDRAEQERGW